MLEPKHNQVNTRTHMHTHSSPAPVSSGIRQVWKCRLEWNLFWAGTPGGSCEHTKSNDVGSFLWQEEHVHGHTYTQKHGSKYNSTWSLMNELKRLINKIIVSNLSAMFSYGDILIYSGLVTWQA